MFGKKEMLRILSSISGPSRLGKTKWSSKTESIRRILSVLNSIPLHSLARFPMTRKILNQCHS